MEQETQANWVSPHNRTKKEKKRHARRGESRTCCAFPASQRAIFGNREELRESFRENDSTYCTAVTLQGAKVLHLRGEDTESVFCYGAISTSLLRLNRVDVMTDLQWFPELHAAVLRSSEHSHFLWLDFFALVLKSKKKLK